MRTYFYIIIFLGISIFETTRTFAQTGQDSTPFTSVTSYVGSSVTNFHGGKRTGSAYLGLLNWKLEINPGKLTENSSLMIRLNAANSHGGQPSSDFVGDFQGVSNIEAGTHSFLYEAFARFSYTNYIITAGLQDMNSAFAFCDCASLFLNSSFGIPSTISSSFKAPIYPLTALGLVGEFISSNGYSMKIGAFDGNPENFAESEYNTKWKLSKNDGILLISELSSEQSLFSSLPGCWKLGAYYHESRSLAMDEPGCSISNYGIYLVADQVIMQNAASGGSLSCFTQISLTPETKNENDAYISFGLQMKGVFAGRTNDVASAAMAHAKFRNASLHPETAFEFNYQFFYNDHFYLKPDIQYILNPGKEGASLPNALVGSMQFGFTF
jgi:porin